MSNSVSLDLVALALKEAKLPPAQTRAILEALNVKVAEAEADKPARVPKGKKQFVVLSTDGHLGWVVQLPEDAAPQSAPDRINEAAHVFNASKKGRLLPVKSLGEACESVPARYLKDAEVKVVTKLVVPILKVANVLVEAPSV